MATDRGLTLHDWRHEETPEPLAWQILTASRIIFHDFFRTVRSWQELGTYGRDTRHLVLLEGDLLAAHLALVTAIGRWSEGRSRILGVAGVFTLPTYRGHGLARRLLERVTAELEDTDCDFGLLFCDPAMTGFYRGLGWRAFPGLVTFGDARLPSRLDPKIDRARWYPLAGRGRPKRGREVYVGPSTW